MKNTLFYQKYLKDELSERIGKNSRYSLRSFAKSLNVDPGDLSKILSGTKLLTPELADKILKNLSLSSTEAQEFIFSIAKAYEQKGLQRKRSSVKSIINKSKDKELSKDLSVDIFRVISDWYHYAILQIIDTNDFVNNPKWIAKELNISTHEVNAALERLLILGLIQEKKGKLYRSHKNFTSGDQNITNSAFKRRIKQVTEKSVFSLENDPIEIRNHRTMTIAIDPNKVAIAKEMIQDFMMKMEDKLQTKKEVVYELQINFFPLQRS